MRYTGASAAILMALFSVAACSLLLWRLEVIPPEALWFIGVAGALLAAAFAAVQGLKRAVRVKPKKRGMARAASVTVDSPERRAKVIEAFNRSAEADVPQLVDYLVQQGMALRASDIHVVPYRDFAAVRFRVDGILTDVGQLAGHLKDSVTNRLKVLSNLVTYVHDKPQDGRFDISVGDRRMDLRIAFMPTLHGERVVMRLLDRAEVEFGMENLGLTPPQLEIMTDIIMRPQGMIILTGPTGSGKTTTIYCALRAVLRQNQNSCSIYTLEDPIEYDLLNINQTQIEEAQGFTFEKGLRTMLRQDPDVIMVGEIRDLPTAKIAIQAGMTGHLIITTVHAKGATAVFMRLIEMGVDPPSVASAVTGVVAQRLVRVLCPSCKRPEPPTPGQEAKLGLKLSEGAIFYGPQGCDKCGMKGYVGRRGVFEILEVNEKIRSLIVDRATPEKIQRQFVEQGTKTLVDHGLAYALKGETSLDEVIRILPLHGDYV